MKTAVARRQHRVPQQQRRHDAEVARVLAVQPRDGRGTRPRTRRPPAATRWQAATTAAIRRRGCPRASPGWRSAPGSSAAGAAGRARGAQLVCRWPQRGHVEGIEQRGGVGRVAHPRQHLERGQRAQQLGLGPVIDVVARRVAGREAALALGPVARLGLRAATGAPGSTARFSAASTLSRKGSRPPNSAAHAGPSSRAGSAADHGVEGGASAAPAHPGRRRGVRSHPQLGLGLRRRGRPALGAGRCRCASPTRRAG